MLKMPSQLWKISVFRLLLLLLLLLFVPFMVNSQTAHIETLERTILLNLKQQWGNPQSMESWNSSSSPCDWPEIQCTKGTVTEIIIQGTYKLEIIPPSICDLKNLTQIDLAYNAIKGGFPTILYNCSKLEYLNLHFNDFDGPIPDDIYRMSNLRYMDLGANQFTNIPAAIGQLSKLKELRIDGNALNCPIPKEIGKLFNLETLNMDYNQFVQAKIPMELGQLKKLKYLSIKYSNLIGEIPETIGNLSSVEEVDLSGNLLNGSIPGGLFCLKNLRSVFLQENKLSGDIPVEAFNWAGIVLSRNNLTISLLEDDYSVPYSSKNLQLCGNQLSRRIPYALQTNECTCKYFDNVELCVPGGIYDFKQRVPGGNSKIGDIAPPIIFLVTSSFFLFLAKQWLRRKQPENDVANYKLTRRKQLENSIADSKLIWFQRLDFTESDILLGLTENNRIGNGGSGTVYLIVIHATGRSVAVKKVWNNRKLDHRLEKQFLAEVQILGKIRHSNIVTLLCCISSKNSKLLVYEYMENQSLDRWLHAKKTSSGSMTGSVQHVVMDWPTRLQIAIGAAEGLSYMHHDCSPPIIHRDIKCSNILLDSEFNARIADFGLAKMLAKCGEPETASAIAGTFGYIAPEYAYTSKVSVKSDIYSFGVVLLELATGREPINVEECTNLAEWAWRHYEEGNSIVDALDEEIKEPCYLGEMTAVFKLGLFCTGTSPSTRPCMREVLQILLCCANNLSC